MPLLDVRNLRLSLPALRSPDNPEGRMAPVDGVSFTLERGECVGLVGESGSGKSLTAGSILGLTRSLPGVRFEGEVLWQPEGGPVVDLLRLSESRLSAVRGRQIAMVFQDPLSCLNPLLRIEQQVGEVLTLHRGLHGAALRRRVVELLELCGVPQPDKRARQYPHQLSGGLRQRALIAVALAGEPQLLIADEPTTALDVTIQAQILELLAELQRERGLAILFITHDLGVVARLCSRVMVMYAGRIVEQAPARGFFGSPAHPYSQGLLRSLPAFAALSGGTGVPAGGAGTLAREAERAPLHFIPGSPPRPGRFPAGCRFHPRCGLCIPNCVEQYPPLLGDPAHPAACWRIEQARALWHESLAAADEPDRATPVAQ